MISMTYSFTGENPVTAYLCSCLIFPGVSCPRAPRDDANPGDAYGQQALLFTKELIIQREVSYNNTYI